MEAFFKRTSLLTLANLLTNAAYIKELEGKHEIPVGKELIHPTPGFVIKCMHQKKRSSEAKSAKLFLNMVHSDKVSKPESDKSDNGTRWSVPFAIGPVRLESDKSGSLVPTFDICFHPTILKQAHASKEFCEFIVGIAKDAVKKAFDSSGEEVELGCDYSILRGVLYKNGSPKALMVSNDASTTEEVEAQQPTSDTEVANIEQRIIPKYKIVEQGVFDIVNHTNSSRPKQLAVHISLDKVTSVAEVCLYVSEKKLSISPGSRAKYQYHLDVTLPYPVVSEKGSARLDKNQGTLVVTLPVVSSSTEIIN